MLVTGAARPYRSWLWGPQGRDDRGPGCDRAGWVYAVIGQPPFTGPNPLAVMNERVIKDPEPIRKLNPEVSPQLEEILYRALERDPRHRYATAAEMAWELEHQEEIGVDEGARRPLLGRRFLPGGRKLLLYAGLALAPILLFVVMLLLARK